MDSVNMESLNSRFLLLNFKDVSQIQHETTLRLLKELRLVSELDQSTVDHLSAQLLDNDNVHLEYDQICSILTFLKSFAEAVTPLVLVPILPSSLTFLTDVVFVYCKNTRKAVLDNAGVTQHQLLTLLHKAVRTSRSLLKGHVGVTDKKLSFDLRRFGLSLCEFLDGKTEIGLDLRCNIGLVICSVSISCSSSNRCTKLICNALAQTKVLDDAEELEIKAHLLAAQDVNRIAFAFGVLGVLNSEELSQQLMLIIGKCILQIDHGTKEVTNLGSARVLEIWTDKLTQQKVPLIETLSSLFPDVEIFVFSYLPGHIDAVKNCCRNILGSLAGIYDMIDDGKGVQNLLDKIMTKLPHIKWVALSCVAKRTAGSVAVLHMCKDLPSLLLCTERTFKNVASETYVALLKYQFSMLELNNWTINWIEPLFCTQECQNNESNWPQKRNIICSILNYGKEELSRNIWQPIIDAILAYVVQQMNLKTEDIGLTTEASLLAVEAIKIASDFGVKNMGALRSSTVAGSFRGLVPRVVLNSWVWSNNPQVRLASFSLLVETRKTTELFTEYDLESLKLLLKYNLVSQNPAFRQQFMSYFKKLVRRLKESFAVCKRNSNRNEELLNAYYAFFKWLWVFFTEEEGVYFGANFSRRCQALECLAELTLTFSNEFELFGVTDSKDNFRYIRWLTDTYENNKIQALAILVRMPQPALTSPELCEEIYKLGLQLCQSVRPPDSVTGRYLIVLLLKKSSSKLHKFSAWNILEDIYQRLEFIHDEIKARTLVDVAARSPVYGYFRCIRMIFEAIAEEVFKEAERYRTYANKLISLCVKFDDLMFPVLGAAAPEGYLPGLSDSSDTNAGVVRSLTAQKLLVCAWRTMKEVCLLLAEMVNLFPLQDEHRPAVRAVKKMPAQNCSYVLSIEQVSLIGEHLLFLLKNLMHRGVFEQVYVGFKILATRLWKSTNSCFSGLPEKWLQEALDEEHLSAKCITRRSGGLPFIFQALLSAECGNEFVISKHVSRLFVMDNNPELSQIRIHSMNVLRGLFRDANFSRAMMPHVPAGLKTALQGLKSFDWTVRNSGLMLYGAVIRRTFGPKLNLMSAPTFFRKFPDMYDYLLGELRLCSESCQNQRSIDVLNKGASDFSFHLLMLLSSFSSVWRVEDDHFRLSDFIPYIAACGSSPDGYVREQASRALIPFMFCPDEKKTFVCDILKKLIAKEITSDNHVHGSLLQATQILKHIPERSVANTSNLSVTLISNFLQLISSRVLYKRNCPAIYEILVKLLIQLRRFDPNGSCYLTALMQLKQQFASEFPENRVSREKKYNHHPKWDLAIAQFAKAEILELIHTTSSAAVWIADCAETQSIDFVTELLKYCKNTNFISRLSGIEAVAALQGLLDRYRTENFEYIGELSEEIAFLDVLSQVSAEAYESLLYSSPGRSLVTWLLQRLITISVQSTGAVDCKCVAIKTLGKLIFETSVNLTPSDVSQFCHNVVKWSDPGNAEIDLRLAVAEMIPSLPCEGFGRFCEIDKCKIWMSIITLAQDDEVSVRSVIHSLTGSVGCDRKSMENIVNLCFMHLINIHPAEGICMLFGLILRHELGLQADEADDVEEGRLFEKSEMNLYNETALLAKIVKENLTAMPHVDHIMELPLTLDMASLLSDVSDQEVPYKEGETLRPLLEMLCSKPLMIDNTLSNFLQCAFNVAFPTETTPLFDSPGPWRFVESFVKRS